MFKSINLKHHTKYHEWHNATSSSHDKYLMSFWVSAGEKQKKDQTLSFNNSTILQQNLPRTRQNCLFDLCCKLHKALPPCAKLTCPASPDSGEHNPFFPFASHQRQLKNGTKSDPFLSLLLQPAANQAATVFGSFLLLTDATELVAKG